MSLDHNSLILGPNPTRLVPLFVLRHRLSSEMDFTVEWFWPITSLSLSESNQTCTVSRFEARAFIWNGLHGWTILVHNSFILGTGRWKIVLLVSLVFTWYELHHWVILIRISHSLKLFYRFIFNISEWPNLASSADLFFKTLKNWSYTRISIVIWTILIET